MLQVVQAAQYKDSKPSSTRTGSRQWRCELSRQKRMCSGGMTAGDVQDLQHLQKIYEVCRLTPTKRHWLPTGSMDQATCTEKPDNLVIRLSSPMVDQGPYSWPNTSCGRRSARAARHLNKEAMMSSCRQCWDPNIKNISYGKH